MKSSIEGLLKVLIWRIDNAITATEFTQIYLEWMKKRDLLKALLNTSTPTYEGFDEYGYVFDLVQAYLKEKNNIELQIPKMLELINTEFNSLLLKVPNLGIDSLGKSIGLIG